MGDDDALQNEIRRRCGAQRLLYDCTQHQRVAGWRTQEVDTAVTDNSYCTHMKPVRFYSSSDDQVQQLAVELSAVQLRG